MNGVLTLLRNLKKRDMGAGAQCRADWEPVGGGSSGAGRAGGARMSAGIDRGSSRQRQCHPNRRSMTSWAWWTVLCAVATARELDPAACASRFDVQRDKIIRTEESREMGARYLSELDVGGRHECLRLCCETDSCDVFVYEEKSPGSCYLFNCGPPEDFRCKFTAHGNFSSGVLTFSRRLAELQDEERLARREQQLGSLRLATTSTTVKSTTVTTPAPRPAPPQHPPEPKPTPQRHCSRYQFECHTGGECIAVYNACDGIPQCADGSDEAPELGCPSAPPEPTTTTTQAPPPPPPVQPESDSSSGEGMAEGTIGKDHWPHRLTQAQPQHRYNSDLEPSSHIFSHKGGLLQEPESNVINKLPPQYAVNPYDPYGRRPWAPAQMPLGELRPWSQPQMPLLPDHRRDPSPPPVLDEMGGAAYHYEWPEPDPRRAWPVPQRRPEMELPPNYSPPKTMPETAQQYSSQHTLRDGPKKGFELMKTLPDKPRVEEKVAPVESSTKKKELKQDPPVSQPHTPAPASTAAAAAAAAAAASTRAPAQHEHYTADEHDGLSEHPPAAIMLLTLGIIMTTVMGVMLGCRARAARRRLRRGKSFAHDADYLVNGMYL